MKEGMSMGIFSDTFKDVMSCIRHDNVANLGEACMFEFSEEDDQQKYTWCKTGLLGGAVQIEEIDNFKRRIYLSDIARLDGVDCRRTMARVNIFKSADGFMKSLKTNPLGTALTFVNDMDIKTPEFIYSTVENAGKWIEFKIVKASYGKALGVFCHSRYDMTGCAFFFDRDSDYLAFAQQMDAKEITIVDPDFNLIEYIPVDLIEMYM